MRIIVIVGARPNFIKVGPLMPALAAAGIDARLAHTGQHYDALMSDVFFNDLSIPEPAWFLGVGSGTHAVQTGSAMVKLEELFSAEQPDAVLVVGDVNSTLAGALAASKIHIPVVHLEAGLRSRDMSMPEEVNRLVTDQLSSMLLTPVVEAGENLENEGISPARIHFVGNIMAESVLRNLSRIEGREVAARGDLPEGGYVLATVHRPENTDHPERLAAIAAALSASPSPCCSRCIRAPARCSPPWASASPGRPCASPTRWATSTCWRSSAPRPPSSPTLAACRKKRACSAHRA
jgi:UDP-N-acetylglucosamine 2-epimerase